MEECVDQQEQYSSRRLALDRSLFNLNVMQVMSLMHSRKQLREPMRDIYINEDFTRARATLLYKAAAKRSARKELLTAGRLMAELLSRMYGAKFTQSATRWSWPHFVARRES